MPLIKDRVLIKFIEQKNDSLIIDSPNVDTLNECGFDTTLINRLIFHEFDKSYAEVIEVSSNIDTLKTGDKIYVKKDMAEPVFEDKYVIWFGDILFLEKSSPVF